MTALSQYDRLEAVGLWRASKDAQRTEVIVSLGERSLVLSNAQNQALAHWSLAAVTRANMGRGGGAASAIYHPIGDPDEELEIAETESAMIEAIETLRRKLNRGRSRPGRLRLFLFAGVVLGLLALGQLWLPEALRNHAVAVAPKVKRVEIGKALMAHVLPITGRPCTGFEASRALGQLQRRVLGHADTPVFVVTDGISTTKVLPGGMVLINSTVLEDHENPDVLAGYLLAQSLRHKMQDPLEDVLRFGGLWGTLQFLTRGTVSDDQLQHQGLCLCARCHWRKNTAFDRGKSLSRRSARTPFERYKLGAFAKYLRGLASLSEALRLQTPWRECD